jgi:uncharacterized protein (TIGR02598 family)
MKRFFPTGSQAFSLVEVTLALGIISFGLIAIMGLIPKGLGIVKESADEAVALNILAAVSSDLQCVGSNETLSYEIPLKSGNSGKIKGFFNGDGNWLEKGETVPSDAVYALSWRIQARSLLSPPVAFISIYWPAQATQPLEPVTTNPSEPLIQPLGSVDCVLVLSKSDLK